jgi:hypothetical protein
MMFVSINANSVKHSRYGYYLGSYGYAEMFPIDGVQCIVIKNDGGISCNWDKYNKENK